MATESQRKDKAPRPAKAARARRGKAWDERLRTVGDANFVPVEWSGRDHPCWPLPRDE